MKTDSSIVYKCMFLILGIVTVIAPISPTMKSEILTSPDILFCLIASSLMNSHRNTPMVLIIFLSLIADFLWYRPLGLTPFLILVSSELLRHYLQLRDKVSIIEEFLIVSFMLFMISTFRELTKFLALVPSLEIREVINYALVTLAIYPLFSLIYRLTNKLSFK